MAKYALAFIALFLWLTVSATLFTVGDAANSLRLTFAEPKYKKSNVLTRMVRKVLKDEFDCNKEVCVDDSCDHLGEEANCTCLTEWYPDGEEICTDEYPDVYTGLDGSDDSDGSGGSDGSDD